MFEKRMGELKEFPYIHIRIQEYQVTIFLENSTSSQKQEWFSMSSFIVFCFPVVVEDLNPQVFIFDDIPRRYFTMSSIKPAHRKER